MVPRTALCHERGSRSKRVSQQNGRCGVYLGMPREPSTPRPSLENRVIPTEPTIPGLRAAAEACNACSLYKNATQTVFGEGPEGSLLMLVGEQPGDVEDIAGKPFVGPLEDCSTAASSRAESIGRGSTSPTPSNTSSGCRADRDGSTANPARSRSKPAFRGWRPRSPWSGRELSSLWEQPRHRLSSAKQFGLPETAAGRCLRHWRPTHSSPFIPRRCCARRTRQPVIAKSCDLSKICERLGHF